MPGASYSQVRVDMTDQTKEEKGRFLDAVQSGDETRVQQMLDENPALAGVANEQGVTALLLSVYHRKANVTALLRKVERALSIHEASAVGDTRSVGSILASDPKRLDTAARDGFTPLGLASYFGHEQTVRALLKGGAEVNLSSRNAQRVAPLHSAAAGNHNSVAEILLENGADPNLQQAGGYTPLQAAAKIGNEAMVNLLLDYGADPSITTESGATAAQLAHEEDHAGIARLLESKAR